MSTAERSIATPAFVASFALLLVSCSPQPVSVDTTLIVNARLADGTGAALREASVRLNGDEIVEVGDLEPAAGESVIDAGGLVLAPGFIDTHSHHDWGLSEQRHALAAVSQGITTIVAGQDGSSQFPLADFFARLEAEPVALNVASYAGHNTVRSEVMGDDFRRPATEEEIEQMIELLRQELAAGALGLSTGLEYDPGMYSETEEVMALAQEAAAVGGRYISHMRSEDRYLWDAVEEIIHIGRQTGMPVQISHMKVAMKGLWGGSERLLERLDEARAEGIVITADVYPYTYWQSTMQVLFPERNWDDPEAVAYVLEEIAPPEGLLIAQFDPEPSYVGKTIADIAELRGIDAVTTYAQLINEAIALEKEGGESVEGIIGTSMHEDDVARLTAWAHSNICSDGALDDRHPRGSGAFPRVLGRYVREQGLLTLEEAIHKMTGLTAEHMGFDDRGVIRPGARADLVLFDPQTIVDRATLEEPHLVSLGIERVWVNGVEVYANGEVKGEFPGQVIKRNSER